MRLVPGEVETALVLVRQGIEAQLRSPAHAYHQRVRQVRRQAGGRAKGGRPQAQRQRLVDWCCCCMCCVVLCCLLHVV